MSVKLALIIDKTDVYINFQRDQLLQEWGVTVTEVERVSRLLPPPPPPLFGEPNLVLLELATSQEGKTAVEDLLTFTEDRVEAQFPRGLLITTSKLNRNQTKKLEATVAKLGGVVHATSAKEELPLGKRLVEELSLRRTVKDFLLAYVGEDYDVLLPLATNLRRLSSKQQAGITEEDLMVRLPQPPGAVLPWSIEEPLFQGDVATVISLARRIHRHANNLVWLTMLKKKFTTYYRVKALLEAKPSLSDKELTESLSLPPRGFYYTKKRAQAYSLPVLEEALSLLVELERKLKGGSTASGEVLSEVVLVRLCYLLGKRK